MAGFGLPPLRRAEDEEEDLESLDAQLLGTPEALTEPAPPRPVSSYDRSAGMMRTHDRENDHADTHELIGNIAQAFRREPIKTRDGRELFAKQRAELASEEGQAKKRAKADAASERSASARALFAATHKDVWDKMEPKIRDRMSEDYIVEIAPVLKGRLAKEDSALDIQEQQSRIDRNNAQRDRYGRLPVERGEKPENPDVAELRRLQIEKAKRELANPTTRETKGTLDDKELHVEGYEFLPSGRPSKTGAEKFKALKTSADVATKSLDSIVSALDPANKDATGTEMFGNDAVALEGDRQAVLMSLKNLYELGVLNGPDLALMEKQVLPLTGMKSATTRTGAAHAAYKKLREQIAERLNSTATNHNYRRKAEAPKAGGANPPPAAGMVRIRDRATGRTGLVRPEDVEEDDEVIANGS